MKIMKATMSTAARGTNASTFRMVKRDAGNGDAANFSAEALNLSTANKNAKFTASTVSVEFEGHTFTFNSANGAMTWDGKKLDFSKFDRTPRSSNTLASDFTLQLNATANELSVYSSSAMSHAFNATTGAQVKDQSGTWSLASRMLDRTKPMIVINNENIGTQLGVTDGVLSVSRGNGGSADDVIINRAAGVTINGGEGNDQIFNFAKNVGTLDGGAGSDAIYSVGLSAGAITAGSDGSDAYVGLVGVMNGGSVTVGKGKNIIEAAGATLNNISITDGGAGTKSTALMAKIVNGGVLNLGADATGLDLGTLNTNVTLGAGANSLVADKVTGVTVTSSGNDSFQLKELDGSKINASGSTVVNVTSKAKNAKIKLGSGANTVNAAGKTLTSVDISDTAGASTAILAGSVIGTAAVKSKIALSGNATDGNGLIVSGAINYADINTGSGKGRLEAASVTNSILNMGVGGTSAQTVTIKGAMTGSTLKTGNGDDVISIITAKNITVDLGDGDNTYTGKTASNLTYTGGSGRDDVHFSGSVVNATMDLGQGVNSFKAASKDKNGNDVGQAVTNTAIKSYGSTTILAGKYTAGLTGNTIDLGVGSHSVTLGSILTASGVRATVKMDVDGTGTQTLTVKGAVKNLDYTGSNGADTLTLNGALSNSTINLGGGTNALSAKSAKGVGQAITNTAIKAYGSTTIEAGKYTAGVTGNAIDLGAGSHSVTLASIAAARGVRATLKMDVAGSQAQSLTVKGAVSNLDYTGSNGADTLTLSGALSNSIINLGGGTNALIAKNAKGVGQSVTNTAIRSYGSTTIEAGKYAAGATGNTIDLGAGSHSVTLASIAGSKSVLATVKMDVAGSQAQTLAVKGAITYAAISAGNGKGTVSAGSMTNATLTMGNDSGLASRTIDITGNMANSTVTAGSGGAAMTVGGSVKDSVVEAGKGDNSLAIGKATSGLTYKGSSQKDDVSIKGALSASSIDLGDGINSVTVATLNKTGGLVGQAISDTSIKATGAASTSITAGKYLSGKTGSQITFGTGVNSLRFVG